jgi:hypothetical protein
MSEFLGPYGQATIILMKTHFGNDLPKMRDLKKILNISDGKYYKREGRFSSDIAKLEKLLETLAEIRGEKHEWHKYSCTEFLVTQANVHSNLFMSLKFNAQIIEGFNLTVKDVEELDKLRDRYRDVLYIRSGMERIPEELIHNRKKAVNMGIQDQSILKPDIRGLKSILKGYGDSALQQATQELIDWHSRHRWQILPPSTQADDIDLSNAVSKNTL